MKTILKKRWHLYTGRRLYLA